MKLKNKTKEIRQLYDRGKLKLVGPLEIIEVEKPVYDSRTFEIFNEKVEKEKRSIRLPKKAIKHRRKR